jgi:hypothetical protein
MYGKMERVKKHFSHEISTDESVNKGQDVLYLNDAFKSPQLTTPNNRMIRKYGINIFRMDIRGLI